MILGHLTVTAAGHHLLTRHIWARCPIALGPLLLGAYLPDLLDKPLALVTGLAGRGYGHSLVVQAVFFAIAWALLWRRAAAWLLPLTIGSLLHLLQDWVMLEVLLAPLLGPVPMQPMEPLLLKLRRFYTSGSPQMWLEVAAALYWLAVAAGTAAGRLARRRSHQRMPSSSAL